MLLFGSGLLIHSLWQLQRVDPGFRSENVLAVETSMASEHVPRLLDRLRVLPGVEAAGVSSMLPLVDNYSCDGFQLDADPVPAGQEPCAEFRVATAGYFESMGIPLLAGRFFDRRDREETEPVVIINQAMARLYFPGRDPVGERLTKSDGRDISREVVGVIGSVRHFGLDQEPVPMYYEPLPQQEWPIEVSAVLRTAVDPSSLRPLVAEEIRALDPNSSLEFLLLDDVIAASVATPRFRAGLLGLFGLLAFALAALGVYGLMAYTVSQRRREMGVRLALGAQRGAVRRLVVTDGLKIIGLGVLFGVAGGAALGRFLERFLFEVGGLDPVTLVVVTLLLTIVALAACALPAYRASVVDPLESLRAD